VIHRRLGGTEDAGRILHGPAGAAHHSDRRAPVRRRGHRDRRRRQFLWGVRGDVRGHGPRQHGLPPRRLHASLRARVAASDDAGLLIPHLLRDDRFGHRAGGSPVHAERGGMARRLPLLGVAALFLALQGEPPVVQAAQPKPHSEGAARASADGWRLLLSPPILLNLVFFVVLSMVGGGLNQYLVVGLGALYGTPPALANTAL